jgi:hypothetical protein
LREVRDGPKAEEQLRKLLSDGTQAGRLYALRGLRQLDASDYDRLAEPFRSNNAGQHRCYRFSGSIKQQGLATERVANSSRPMMDRSCRGPRHVM